MRKLLVTAFTALTVGALVANASSADAAAAGVTKTITAPMTTVGIVREVGTVDAAGNVPVLLTNGATISYPRRLESAQRGALATPDGSVSGNCGTSYINLYERSDGHPVHMTTGFHVIHSAVDYSWHADILGPDYDYEYSAGGALFFDSTWSGQHTSHKDYPRGIYDAYVLAGSSYAILDTGSVCFSGGPTASRLL